MTDLGRQLVEAGARAGVCVCVMQPLLGAIMIIPNLVVCTSLLIGKSFAVSTVVCLTTIAVLHPLRNLHVDALHCCVLLQ